MTLDKVLYADTATATGGRTGSATSSDGALSVNLSTPRELGGGGEGANPEQLFAAGYSACFIGAMKAVGPSLKIIVPDDVSITSEVGIGPIAEGFGVQVGIHISLPGLERDNAETLVAAAHKVCPYSNATRGNISVTLSIV